jgi:iron complex outermembrane receptor protein
MAIAFDAARLAVPLTLVMSLVSASLIASAQSQPAQAIDEVVVTGVPVDRDPGELAQSVTVIRGDELARSRAATLGETLASQLGVSSSQFGAGASRPIIRGLAGARVQVLEDGLDTMDAATLSDDHAVGVDALAADQIEIFRGPTTLLYGSGAVGGVINTVTTRIPTRSPDGLDGAFELRADSVAGSRSAAVRLDAGGSKFAWHFDAARRDSDDYEIPGFARADAGPDDAAGFVPNSAAESDAAALGGSWLGDQGFFGVGMSLFDTLYGIPGHAHEDGAEPPVTIDLKQRRLDVRGGWMRRGGAIEAVNLRVGVNDYEHVELEGDAVGTQFTNDGSELRLELEHRAIGAWTGALGVQRSEREFAALGDEAFVPPVETVTLGVFLVEQLERDRWQLSLGGRVESTRHVPTNGLPRYDERATSLSFGSVREVGDSGSLVLTLAVSERIPVAEELYSDGPHLATSVVQLGVATLGQETARHVDVGFRGRRGAVDWSVTGFRTRYGDFIYLADSGALDAVHELPIFVYGQADADFSGIEAEVDVPLLMKAGNAVDLRLFADYVRGELASGESLPRLPPLRYGARLEYRNERFLAGLEAARHDAQDHVAVYEQPTAGYTLVGADFRWQLVAGAAEIEVFATASNLGDAEARKHTSFVNDLAPLPGRNFAVGVRSRF